MKHWGKRSVSNPLKISVNEGIGGMSFKERLIFDGIVVDKGNGEYGFNSSKVKGTVLGFSDEDNSMSCDFEYINKGDVNSAHWNDYLAWKDRGSVFDCKEISEGDLARYMAVNELCQRYPDVPIHVYGDEYVEDAYGVVKRTTFDEYYTNGKLTDGNGIVCIDSSRLYPSQVVRAEMDTILLRMSKSGNQRAGYKQL